MKKIFITGSAGQLGQAIIKLFKSRYEIISTSRSSYDKTDYFLDITDPILTKDLIETISPDIIINLASNEYSKVIDLKCFSNVVTPIFKDFKNGKSKVISFFAKKARGSFARFVMTEKPKKIDDLISFNGLGYQFFEINAKNEIIFSR